MQTTLLRAAALPLLAGVLSAQAPLAQDAAPPADWLPALIPVHTAPADDIGGAYGIWAAGRDYKVSFHDGVAFHPSSATRAGESFRWRTTGIVRGAQSLAGAASAPRPRWSDTRVEFDHGAVVEAYDVRPEGVEQTFTLREPQGEGDLVIQGTVEGGLACAESPAQVGALHFTAHGGAAVRYGAAVAIDARGRRGPVTTAQAGGRITLSVAGAWLRDAAWPVVVDPLISDGNVHTSTTSRVLSVDLYRDDQETTRNLWLTWTVVLASGDLDLVTVRVEENAPALGATTVFADITTNWDAQDGRLAGIGGPGKVITAFVRGFPLTGGLPGDRRRAVRRHVHDKADVTLDTAVAGLSPIGQEHHSAPVIGGTAPFDVGRFALLVFQRDVGERFFDSANSDVLAVVLDLAGTGQGVTGPVLPLATLTDRDEQRPAVNREAAGGASVRWLVAWQTRTTGTGSDDIDIVIRPVDSGSSAVLPLLTTEDEADATTDKLDPVLAGSGGRYLLAYRQLDRSGLRDRVRVQRIDWGDGNVAGQRPHPAVTLDGDAQARFLVAGCAFDTNTESHWALLRARVGSSGNPTSLLVYRLGFRGRPVDAETIYATVNPLAVFRHPGNVVFNDDADSFPLVFATRELGREEIQAHRLTTKPVTPEAPYGTSCSTALIDWTGSQRIGSETEGPRLRVPAGVGVAVLVLGTQPADMDLTPLGLAGCRLLVDVAPGSLIGFFPLATTGGAGMLPLPLLEEYPGMTVRAQGIHVEGAALVTTRGLVAGLVR